MYRYNVLAENRYDFGFGVGLHFMRLGVGIAASGISVSEEFRMTVPMPVLGMGGRFSFTPKLHATASIDALYIEISGMEGILRDRTLVGLTLDTRVALEYDLMQFFGIGIGYNYFKINAAYGNNVAELSLDYDYDGLLIYGRAFF